MSDHELLQHYARDHDQPAFASLVERHLALVYSAARRQVRSSHLAEEVAQSVFLDLARHAPTFPPDQPLVAWLHIVARRTAIDVVRCESRRSARELAAAALAATMNPVPAHDPWSEIEPLLDEAVESLREPDRTAILLRFFENKSLRDIGSALGTTDDAAQKRVTRALDQLRTFFLRRGLTLTAAGLATDLSAHAISTAPSSLGPAISTGVAALPHAALALARDLAMTTAQKILLTATLALVLGGTLYELRSASLQDAEQQSLQATTAQLHAELSLLARQTDTATRELAALRRATPPAVIAAPPTPGSDAALDAEMAAWMARAARLRQLIAQTPALVIPEMKQFLNDDTLFAFASTAEFETDAQIRQIFFNLRHSAKNTLGNKMPAALRAYLVAHDNTLPTTPAQLEPFFDPPIDPAILARYEMTSTGKLDDAPAKKRSAALITESASVDEAYDSRLNVGSQGMSLGPFDYLYGATREAAANFLKAHPGATPINADQLSPYYDPPLRPADQQKLLQNGSRYLSR